MKSKQKQKRLSRKSRIAIVVVAVLFIVLVGVYDFYVSRNAAFYVRWAECGQKPVGGRGSGFLNAGAIHYEQVGLLRFTRTHIEYFCTPLEAERAGYSSDPNTYEFPALKEAGELDSPRR